MRPTDKNGKPFKTGDRVKKVFGHRRIEYWGTILDGDDPMVLWDNGEIELVEEWECQDLEIVPQ